MDECLVRQDMQRSLKHISMMVFRQKSTSRWKDNVLINNGDYRSKKRDLLPNHGWFPKLFQNIFILKSHKRMFSETKVKKKRNILVLIQSRLQCKLISHSNDTKVHVKEFKQSKQHWEASRYWFRGSPGARLLSVLTSRSCRGRSSNRCCSSRAGYRTCAMSDTAPEGHKLFHVSSLRGSYTVRYYTSNAHTDRESAAAEFSI